MDKSNKDSTDGNNTPKSRTVKISNRKTPTPNTVSEAQTSDSNPNTGTDKNESDSTGWNNLPDMTMTSNNIDKSDTDGME